MYSVKQVASILGISNRTVYRLLESKKLQGVKTGRLWRISEEALQAYLKWHVNNSDINENYYIDNNGNNSMFYSGQNSVEDNYDPFSDTAIKTKKNGKAVATRTQPRSTILGATRTQPREIGEVMATREVSRITGRTKNNLKPNIYLEYIDAEEKVQITKIPLFIEEGEEVFLLHGKNEYGEPQKICIKKDNKKLEAINRVIDADSVLSEKAFKYYDELSGSFNWDELFEYPYWTDSQMAALKWMYYLDNIDLQNQNVSMEEDRIQLLKFMDKHLQSACLESLEIIYNID